MRCVLSVLMAWGALAAVAGRSGLAAEPPQLPAAGDPEAGNEMIIVVDPAQAAQTAAATAGAGCEPIGDFTQQFTFASRFRGNVYRMSENRTLTEFKIQLAINGTVDLYFSIHKADEPGGTTFSRLAGWSDIVVTASGTGTAELYSSGTVDVTLEAGEDYLIGAAWGTPAITYGRDVATYPMSFEFGEVRGSGALSLAVDQPPVPEQFTTSVFAGGAYSMEICLSARTGACCVDSSPCAEMTQFDCLDTPGAEFTAEGISCEGITCPLPHGACCVGANCFTDNPYSCEALGGVYAGDDTTCEDVPSPCDPTGCCCNGVEPDDGVTQSECEAAGGIYQGDDTVCAELELPCDVGACCVGPPEFCFDDTGPNCDASGGAFAGAGTRCDTDPCSPRGACCTDTTCTDGMTQSECEANFGTYRGDDTLCEFLEVSCGKGACCTDIGCLSDLTESLCFIIDGIPLGEGSTCEVEGEQCPGQCCWQGGCVAGVTIDDCNQLPQGEFVGFGFSCSPDPCGTAIGACCRTDGTCDDVSQVVCDSLGGTYSGDGTDCASTTCDEPDPFGACCLDSGCINTTADGCAANSGVYRGDDTMCEVDTCLTGACCLEDDTCLDDTLSDDCAAQSGTFFEGSSCALDPCVDVPAPKIASSDPPSGAVDARQPHDPSSTTPTQGYSSVQICFDSAVFGADDGDVVGTNDFITEETTAGGTVAGPAVTGVTDDGDNCYTVTFERTITPQAWTTVIALVEGTDGDPILGDPFDRVDIGYLPGDVDALLTSGALDLLKLIDHLNMVVTLDIWSVDIDRSGLAAAADVLRLVDLLNGAGEYDPYLGLTLVPQP